MKKNYWKIMLVIGILLISLSIFYYFVIFLPQREQTRAEKEQQKQSEIPQENEITRKDELQLEGFIDDYFYRRKIKDSLFFDDFDAYGSVIAKSIVIYVYPKSNLSQSRLNDIKEIVEEGLHSTLLNFSDFGWAEEYNFDIVIR
ncbi:MAG: hypothetical protein PHV78_01695 [Patescibacteria group bacterium]|nr:hypothetical protein [Patescibacteria group bacterium]MDD5121136.1 hypothetical protein [Patescibacteria group bacterium]MDD5221651.1 hypothetical protein [Patescibacteria group bacterium]MDD5395945.1 hypothetical protein [Patescibacteria group bacterium]